MRKIAVRNAILFLLPVMLYVCSKRLVDHRPQLLMQGHLVGQPIAISPDERWIITQGNFVDRLDVLNMVDKQGTQLSAKTPQGFQDWRITGNAIAFDAHGKILVCGGTQRSIINDAPATVNVWAVDGWRHLNRIATGRVYGPALAVSPDGKVIAAGGKNQKLCLWSVESGQLLHSWPGHLRLLCADFSPDGHLLAHAGDTGNLVVSDVLTGRELWQLAHPHEGMERGVTDVKFSPDGTVLAVGDWINRVRLFDSRSGNLIREWQVQTPRQGINGSKDETHWISFSPDGNLLASGGFSGANIWRVSDGFLVRQLDGCGHPSFLNNSEVVTADRTGRNIVRWKL